MNELSDLNPSELEKVYEKKIRECVEAGKAWAEAKAVFGLDIPNRLG